MPLTKILFRVNVGPRIGLGHLQRSLSLATAFERLDVECKFLVNGESATAMKRICTSGFAFENLPDLKPWSSSDAQATGEFAISETCQLVLVDSQDADAKYIATIRDAGLYVVVRDDIAEFPFPCQMVINGNAGAEDLHYRSSSGDTIFLLGTKYMVLGQDFWNWRPKDRSRPVQNVLITLGGTDDHNLMPRILETLDRLTDDITLTAVIGPIFENVGEVETIASRMKKRVSLVHGPSGLRDVIMEADLAVSAAGQTIYELARAGCPTVAMSVATNQNRQLMKLTKAGFLRRAGDAAKDDVITGINRDIRSLLEDPLSRSLMASAGRRLVDGLGAQRVAQMLVGIPSPVN